MPNSSPLGKDYIKEWFNKWEDVKIILDVGAGAGTYRKLLDPDHKKCWIAVEIWEDYIKKYQLESLYNYVYKEDIKDVIKTSPCVDLVIFGDVLEHLPKKEAKEVLEIAVKNYPHIIVSIPIGLYEQGPIEDNEYEKHLSTWSWQELEKIIDPKEWQLFKYCPECPPDLGIGVFIK